MNALIASISCPLSPHMKPWSASMSRRVAVALRIAEHIGSFALLGNAAGLNDGHLVTNVARQPQRECVITTMRDAKLFVDIAQKA